MDVVTQQGDQSLRAWWHAVAHFYFSLRCESHLNCLTDTRHGVNFSWQTAFFFYKVIELCTWALQRWCVFRHIRISSGFTPVEIHPHRFAGSQMHTVVQTFLRLHKYIYIYYKHKHMLPKLCMNKCKICRSLAENFQALDRRETTHPSSRNSTAVVASLSNLHLYHFDGKFHQFALQLPKLTVLKTSQELCRLCYYSSKITATF